VLGLLGSQLGQEGFGDTGNALMQVYSYWLPATAVTNHQQSGQFNSRGSALLASCAASATGRARVVTLLPGLRRGLKEARLPAFAVICWSCILLRCLVLAS
jgi:hypothetical protein